MSEMRSALHGAWHRTSARRRLARRDGVRPAARCSRGSRGASRTRDRRASREPATSSSAVS